MTDHSHVTRKCNLKTLKPKKHKKIDFFIADEVEISSFRDDMASMEHPFFALKSGDTKRREYKNGNVTVSVEPNVSGLATVFDKDIWIYAISKLQQAINNDDPISRTVCFTPYDFLVTTNRELGGRTYIELEKSLDRLAGTRIKTSIIYSDDEKETENFGMIDKWEILQKKKGILDVGIIKITLPDWLYQAIKKTKVLKISSDYFRIRKAIDRRLYQIARKHCGNQEEFIITLIKLYQKSGSTALLKKFRHNIKQLSQTNDLPDYEIAYDPEEDKVTFKNRNFKNEDKIITERHLKQFKEEKKNKPKKLCNNKKPDWSIPEGFISA